MDGRWLRLSARALCFSGGFVIDYLWLAYGVGFGRFVRRQFLPTLSLVRARVSYGRPAWRRFRSIATPPLSRGVLMAKGARLGPPKTHDRPADDRLPRLVYAALYLETYSLPREFPNFKLVLIW